jgi:hypothetical protein
MRKPLLIASVLLALGGTAWSAPLTIEDKVALQTTMFQHLEASAIDGVIPHVTLQDGSVVDLVATKSHPMILEFGDKFVLCTDLRDPEGKFVNADFYVARSAVGFTVFQVEINNRAPLEELMKAGKVSMLQ